MPVHLRQYWQAIGPLQGIRGAALRLHLLTGGQRIEQLRQLVRSNVGEGVTPCWMPKGAQADEQGSTLSRSCLPPVKHLTPCCR